MGINPNLAFIWHDLMNEKGRKASKITLAYVLIGAALSITSPYGIGLVIEGVGTDSIKILLIGALLFTILQILDIALNWLQIRSQEIMFQECFYHIPFRITTYFTDRPLSKLLNEDNEVDGGGVDSLKDKVWSVVKNHVYTIIPNYSLILFGTIACFWVNLILGLIVVCFIFIETIIGIKQNNYIFREMEPVINGYKRWERRMREWWNATPLIKSNGVEHRICQQVADEVQGPLRADDAIWRTYYPRVISKRMLLALGFQISIYGLAANQALQNNITTEEFVLLFFSFQRVIQALRENNSIQREVQFQFASIDKYRRELIKPLPFRHDEGIEFNDKHIGIHFSNISLSLGKLEKKREILKDVSFEILPGENVGIVGPSGAGKSQLVNLILRGTDPDSGQVFVNNTDLRELSLQTFTRYLGIVPQKSELFEDTIAGNVTFGVSHLEWKKMIEKEGVEQRVVEALSRAGLDLNDRLMDGVNTKIGYKGMRLSGGQQQRLMIAQAYLKQPRMIIADEATSSLDSISESRVIEHLYKSLPKETTVIMIAHRLSTLMKCEKIIFVRPIEECGHGETQVTVHTSMLDLYNSEPIFQKLADAQGFRP